MSMTTEKITAPPTDVAGYNPLRDAGDCTFDCAAANHAIDFFPSCLTHVKGHTGRFTLQPWERDITATLYGWKRPNKTRRYRECLIACPRKNGKTSYISGTSIYDLRCLKEPGPEVYCAAYSRDQASLIFDIAAAMVRNNEIMSDQLSVHESTKRIVCQLNSGFLRAIPAEVASSWGFNASSVNFDELHTQTDRNLYDALRTSQGTRRQPLFKSITTAGHDRNSICWEVWDYARKVRDGVIRDPYFLPVIYEIREDEDWESPEVWKRVNPNLGVSISEEFLQEQYQRAKEIVAYENTFKNLYLNMWTEQANRWFSMDRWDLGSEDVEIPYGAECWCGLDLSTTTDISAFVMVFPVNDVMVLKPYFWVPEDAARIREQRDRVPYRQWISEGFMRATPGGSVDYDIIRRDINQLRDEHNINTIAVDRWNATQLVKQLSDDGFNVGLFGQGYASMTAPSKLLEGMVIDGTLRHGGHPVLRWMAGNVAIETDAAGNIKPSKKASTEKIDGIVALVMGLGVWATSNAAWSAEEVGL